MLFIYAFYLRGKTVSFSFPFVKPFVIPLISIGMNYFHVASEIPDTKVSVNNSYWHTSEGRS